jgi:hypothetical protein
MLAAEVAIRDGRTSENSDCREFAVGAASELFTSRLLYWLLRADNRWKVCGSY